nr:AAA family ATPase [Spirochaetota bacterium]
QGGLLTEAIRRTPHAVLLLDEIEKAHEDIFNILLQIMDHAALTDNAGRKSDFHNVILVMTSNAGAREMSQAAIGFGDPHLGAGGRGIRAIEKLFSPEFRNRLDETIVFKPLSPDVMRLVVDKFINLLRPGLKARKITLEIDETAREYLATRGYDPVYGARPLDRLIQTSIKDPLSEEILFGRLAGGGHVTVRADADGLSFEIPRTELV